MRSLVAGLLLAGLSMPVLRTSHKTTVLTYVDDDTNGEQWVQPALAPMLEVKPKDPAKKLSKEHKSVVCSWTIGEKKLVVQHEDGTFENLHSHVGVFNCENGVELELTNLSF